MTQPPEGHPSWHQPSQPAPQRPPPWAVSPPPRGPGEPGPAYGQPEPAYGQPEPTYRPPDPAYRPPGYGPPDPAYGPGGPGAPADHGYGPGGPGGPGDSGYPPPPGGFPPPVPGPPPRRRRRWLLIGSLALVGVLVLCGVGGVGAWLLTRDPDRNGAETPVGAVQSFLQAVYRDLDPAAAASMVCSEARDEDSLATKIDEIRAYEQTELSPSFSWSDPSVVQETDQLAVLSVTVTMTTDDEKTAQQTLHVSVLDKDQHGWWVCDLETAGEPDPEASAATPAPTEGTESPGGEEGDGE